MNRGTSTCWMGFESTETEDAAVQCIAECLTATLGITLPADGGRDSVGKLPSMGELMRDEYTYVPNRKALDAMSQLRRTYEFAQDCHQFASKALQMCAPAPRDGERFISKDVDLSALSSTSPFYLAEYVNCGHSRLQVGGLGAFLLDDVRRMAEDWLWDCDHVLANAIEEHKGPRSDTVARLISTMAFKIARCHTNMSPCRNEFPIGSNSFFTNEKLTYVRLGLEGTRAAELLEREGMQYILRISCMQTPQKTRNDILSHGTGAIQAFLSSISKYITVDDQQKLNLPFAARMAFDHVPLVVKVEISARWAFEHGAEARRIIESACLYSKNCPLSRDESIVSDRLSSMVQLTSDSKGKALPAISWTQSRFSQINVLVAPDETLACNMGTETLRCLRIITMVQKMGDIGFFSQGIVSKEILRPACLEMQVHARMAMEILHQSKLRLNRGVSLLIMLQFVSDRCSDAATMMDRALCSLSRFPMAYLNYISNPKSTGFSQRLQDISQAMRCIGGRGANITYPRLALDTLKIVLPILHDRRSALGIGSHNPSSAMREMLRLVRGTRTVQIKKEMYVSLKLKNIRAAHPALEFALDSLARTHPNVVSTHYMSLDSANHKNTKPKWKARERKWEKQTPSVFIHAHHFQSLVSVNPKNVC